jgi:hypothetical protein
MSIGKALIEEQACLLNGLLSYSSSLLGSPCELAPEQQLRRTQAAAAAAAAEAAAEAAQQRL